ncbi:acyl-coenzyme A thioesterase 13 [Drosophila kikkawai]|uniref:Acyl-coenzyme A thioesterase 13 n=1 Tax=Drosophila kikkawai TaxID=30033 RepID=A0A6P4I230_DROKI|nr:acyl-coenzyme A thioesterase 13 [Drosophila kikkawai]
MASKKFGLDFVKNVSQYISGTQSFDRVVKMIQITDGGDGRAVGEFTVEKEHLNRGGTLHGGLTATIVDNVTTYALMSKGSHPGVSVNLNVNYISPARPGEVVEVEANTVRAGKKLAYLDCVLRRKSDGRIIANGGQVKFVDFDKDKKDF